VVRDDQRRALQLRDDIGNRVGFSGAGGAEKYLMRQAVARALGEFFNRLRLVAGGRKRRVELESVGRRSHKYLKERELISTSSIKHGARRNNSGVVAHHCGLRSSSAVISSAGSGREK